jgi:hypothetical protein
MGGRTRTLSISYSDPKLAEPKVDTSHASWVTSAGSGGDGGAGVDQIGNGVRNENIREEVGGVDGGTQSQTGEDGQTHGQAHEHGHGQGHHGGHLLKNLVGGIFHRKHSDHNHPTPTPPTTTTKPNPPQTQSHDSQSHSIIRSQPIRPPNNTSFPSTAQSNPPAAFSSGTGINGNTQQSTSSEVGMGVRLAKPVTPRVRTREERSVESGVKLGLGAPLGDDLGPGGRRAKIEEG